MNDIEKSEIVISKIVNLLMSWGIQECTMEFDELELDPEEFGGFFFPCVDWLVSEGVIRVQDIRRYTDSNHSGFPDRPVLTSYGFQLLEQKISVGADAERLANRVKEVSSNGVGYANVGDLIGGILGGFTKSIGS